MGHDQDLIRYYDQDAARRDEAELRPIRTACRQRFVELLSSEGRETVVEMGCGPGHDGRAFAIDGIEWTGLDLSIEHARRANGNAAQANGNAARALVGSLFDPPLRAAAFDAGWSMSTLVHVADADFDRAMAAITRTLGPGAPLGLGLWGGADVEGHATDDQFDPPRFFSRRGHRRLRTMLAGHGEVEHFETHDVGAPTPGWEYQFAIVRTPR